MLLMIIPALFGASGASRWGFPFFSFFGLDEMNMIMVVVSERFMWKMFDALGWLEVVFLFIRLYTLASPLRFNKKCTI